jgi:succinate dehydrogenase flavin-adding protein (antitoxin of CptAB toxin-antitoxin module)
MAIDIYFHKPLKINDIKEKTNLEIKFIDGDFFVYKNEDGMRISCYYDFDFDIDSTDNFREKYIKQMIDKGLDNYINYMTVRGCKEADSILEEIALKLQTMFILDCTEEFEYIMCSDNDEDVFDAYKSFMHKDGFLIIGKNNYIIVKI